MARLGVSKKKKSPRATESSQLKKELERVTEQLESCKRELAEGIERETATGEILRVIASSPTDLQSVLDAVAENAARLCDSNDAQLRLIDGNILRLVASYGSLATPEIKTITRQNVTGRAVIDRQMIHVHDLETERETEYPDSERAAGGRTVLAIPLLREGTAIGAILIRRLEVRPFTDEQISLLKTFADQAVIAIENTRLFQELKQKTADLETSNSELREALDQQTATSEILGVIASSPTNIQPVLDVVAENAARLCDANDAHILRAEGGILQRVAVYGSMPVVPMQRPITRGTPAGRAVLDRKTMHVHDLATELETEFPDSAQIQQVARTHTILATPLLREDVAIGAIVTRRAEVRPFTDKQISLLKIFADQAVIAIENVRLFKELKESLEQQTATSEILGVIASSPTDIQPVLDVVAENAARVCGSYDAVIRLVEGNILRLAAHYGPVVSGFGLEQPLIRGTIAGRAVIDRQTIHIHDLWAESETEFAVSIQQAERLGHRTYLATPLLREGVPIGVILIRRREVRPFSEKQIALLKTFADQAVIAIENVRLFKEIQERNAELREALEHQTATGEVLGIISRSPTNVQPVLDAIVESAARVCGVDDVVLRLNESNALVPVAHFGSMPPDRVEVSIDAPHIRWMREHGALHVPDVRAQNDFPTLGRGREWRTILAAPLRQQGELIGVLSARRTEVRPFTPAQIKLLETFADQAVIAIENVRLFNELKESLEQQTATSEILSVIASSPTDIQPVLETITERAARVCSAEDGVLRLVDGNVMRLAAHYGSVPGVAVERPINRQSPPGRAVLDRKIVHIADAVAVIATEYPDVVEVGRSMGAHAFTVLAVPLMREDAVIGVIHFRRPELRPFTDKQIALVKTFADQAVIAIENVRLFKELQERNAELREALEHQTATSEVLAIISRSPTDVQPVLDAIVESAARVCGIDDVQLRLREGNKLISRAHFGSVPIPFVELDIDAPAPRWVREHGTLHIPDVREQNDIPFPSEIPVRTFLAAPLRLPGEFIGGLVARCMDVRPFTPVQIKLLETFADQAVIAIENVRLFQELTEALEQQTATNEILSVIASSPTDIQPVLNAVTENAARLCDATDAQIRLVDGNMLQHVAAYGPMRATPSRVISRDFTGGRAIVDRRTIHIHDLEAVREVEYPETPFMGIERFSQFHCCERIPPLE